MSILAQHLPFVNEHIAVQDKLAKKFAPGTKIFNEYRHSLHLSNLARFKALHEDLEAVDKMLDEAPARSPVQTPVLTLKAEDLEGLPAELVGELSDGAIPDKGESVLLLVIDERGGIASLDQILIGIYRKTGEVMKRTTLTSKLYRLTQKGVLFALPTKKGAYSTRKLTSEDVARLFGEDPPEQTQESLALKP